MTNMPKIFILSAICFALGGFALAADFGGEITVGTVTVAPGEQVGVPVSLSGNSIDIMALTVPLRFSSPYLTVDSVSFAGSLKPSTMNAIVSIGAGMIRFTFSPAGGLPVISESDGLLATIYFTAAAGASDHTVPLDSINRLEHDQTPQLWTRPEITDNSGSSVYWPAFTAGIIEVRLPTAVEDNGLGLPAKFALNQNYPNPFNPTTTIVFSLPERSQVSLKIYNILGQEIETLLEDRLDAGQHEVVWEAQNFASGVYFYRLTHNNRALTKKMTILK